MSLHEPVFAEASLRSPEERQRVGQFKAPADDRFAHSSPGKLRSPCPDHTFNADALWLLAGLVTLADGLAVILGSAVAYLRFKEPGAVSFESVPTTLLSAALLLVSMQAGSAYSRRLHDALMSQCAHALRNWTAVFGLFFASVYLTTDPDLLLETTASAWYLATILGLFFIRGVAVLCVHYCQRGGKLARRVAFVDVDGKGEIPARRFLADANAESSLVGIFSLRGECGSGLDELIEATRSRRVDDIIVLGARAETLVFDMALRRLEAAPSNLHFYTDRLQLNLPRARPTILFDNVVLTLHRRPLFGWDSVIKHAEDFLLAALCLLLLLPLMAAIAVAIKLDSKGPALFCQRRLGLNNRDFQIFKFRTMTFMPGPELDVPQACRNDPRVTRVGRLLRRTSLDELPQLFNVLRGDMSLVGPRPHALPHNYQYSSLIDGYWGRHRVRPGITGWAQVNGLRGETDVLEKMQQRVDYDLDYIDNWSLLLDLKVLARTLVVCFLGWEAY